MSTRQIGSALGVSQKTADRDIRAAESNDSRERKVTASDGKTRTYEAKSMAGHDKSPGDDAGACW